MSDLNDLNDHMWKGRRLNVAPAKEKAERWREQ
jgi:hypothetical protein